MVVIAAIALILPAADFAHAKNYGPPKGILAFPGAEGFGAYTRGGRYGKVLIVTNLEDYDPQTQRPIPGSLRKAIETDGPRTVVFRVSGTIGLKKTLSITKPYITIAGQSAPGDGICIKNYGVAVRASQVIIRYMRFRPGDEIGRQLSKKGKFFQTDALSIESYVVSGYSIGPDVSNIIFDHCSASWATDEVMSLGAGGRVSPISNVTVQWCIISEGLNNSFHHEGSHPFGSIIEGENITFHHNIYAHHKGRSPLAESLPLDFRNNLIYNSVGSGHSNLNYIGNYLKRIRFGSLYGIYGLNLISNPFNSDEIPQFYAEGNFMEGADERSKDQWSLISGVKEENKMAQPFDVAPVTTDTAKEAYRKVLDSCGAILPKRDAADRRLIADIKAGKGDLIDSQRDVGGWPELRSTQPPKDTDNDGMPDEWEIKYGLNPKDDAQRLHPDAIYFPNDSGKDADGDGYTNIEEYLNGTNPLVKDTTAINPQTVQLPIRIGWEAGTTGTPDVRHTQFANIAAAGLNTVCFNTRLFHPGVTTWQLQPDGDAVIKDWPGTATFTKAPLQSPQDYIDYCNDAASHGLDVLFTITLYSVDWDQLNILGDYQKTFINGPWRYGGPGWNAMPAPLEKKYWLGLALGAAKFYAELSLQCPNVKGFVMDFETYGGSKGSTYMARNNASFDDQTWNAVIAEMVNRGVLASPPAVSMTSRYYWLENKGVLEDYFTVQSDLIYSQIAVPFRQAIDAINPNFMLGFYPYWPSDRLNAYMRGWSTDVAPAIAMSENEYYSYQAPQSLSIMAALEATGANYRYLPGFMIHANSHTAADLEDDIFRAKHFGRPNADYWVYSTSRALYYDDPDKLLDPAADFWQAITNANYNLTTLPDEELYLPEYRAPAGSELITANRFYPEPHGTSKIDVTFSRKPDLTFYESSDGSELFDGGYRYDDSRYDSWLVAWKPVLSENIVTEVDLGDVYSFSKVSLIAATHLGRFTTAGGILTIETSQNGADYTQLDQQTLAGKLKRYAPYVYEDLALSARYIKITFNVTEVPANSTYTLCELAVWRHVP